MLQKKEKHLKLLLGKMILLFVVLSDLDFVT